MKNLLLAGLVVFSTHAFAQGTAFTYQGRLNSGANAANGSYDLQFSLWSAASGPSQLGGNITNAATAVSNGVFTVTLDFGNQFPGADRWLEIGVRTNGNGAFTTLTPRQPLTPSPYSVFSGAAASAASANSVAAANITGVLPLARLPATVVTNGAGGVNISGTFSGNGAGVTNVSLISIAPNSVIFWPGDFNLGSNAIGQAESLSDIASADVNGDGKPDLITANYGAGTVTKLEVFTNSGGGTFVSSTLVEVGGVPIAVTSADMNGDGRMDLICANQYLTTGGSLMVLTNNGNGGFGLRASLGTNNGTTVTVLALDVNNDTKIDLVGMEHSLASIYTNNGSGGFTLASSVVLPPDSSTMVAVDANGDGKVDLFGNSSGGSSQPLLINTGNGVFTNSSVVGPGGNSDVAAGDVNGDGKADLLGFSGGSVYILTNNANNGFSLMLPSVTINANKIELADVNRDGKLDLIGLNYSSGDFSVLTNLGNGTFGAPILQSIGGTPKAVTVADLNGDGVPDLGIANSYYVTVLLSTPRFSGNFSGDGSGLTSLNAANLSGTIGSGNLPASPNFSGTVTASAFSGNGSGLTSLNTTNLVGTISDARLSANVALRAGGNTFTGQQILTGGNVGIGASTPMASVGYPGGWEGLHIQSPANNGLEIIQGATSARLHLRADSNVPNGSQDFIIANGANKIDFMWLTTGLAGRLTAMTITTNGNLIVAGTVTANNVVLTSDRNAKENFTPVSTASMLEKVAALPITEWNYKNGASDLRHIGPMAQDFQNAFGLNGGDEQHISVVDASGVALAAIQGLNEKVEDRVHQLEIENAELRQRLEKLEQLLDRSQKDSK